MTDLVVIAIVSGLASGIPATIIAVRTQKKFNGYVEQREQLVAAQAAAKTAAELVIEVAKHTAKDLASRRRPRVKR